MPQSSSNGKPFIDRIVRRLQATNVLDIGVGCGTYSLTYRQFLGGKWTGIEVWEPYVKEFNLRDLYDQMIVADAREAVQWLSGPYDVAFAGDVLEHMPREDAQALLARLLEIARTVIVSIPIGYYPQDDYNGNPFERHIVDHWTHDAFVAAFGQPDLHTIHHEIGVYIYTREKQQLRPRIAVYAISKNEEQFVERFCQSAKDADLVVIADTGSTDRTVELAKQSGATVHDICITPWRFDLARNAALALVPRDIDICISLDLDEVMEPGWREEIERVWKPDTTRLRYQFDWGMGIRFMYEKIHARHGYRWHHPVHEYPVPDERITEVYAQTDRLLVSHHPDSTKSRGQYMPLLELAVKEDPRCPRNAFYHARELTFYSRWPEAIDALTRYLEMPEATWPNERCYAMRLLGKAHEEIGQGWEAMQWFRRACAEAPNTREPWCDLAMACYRRHEWHECYAAAMKALAITDRALVYTCDPAVWGALPHDMAALAAYHLGLHHVAIEQGRLAAASDPNDPRLAANLDYYTQAA